MPWQADYFSANLGLDINLGFISLGFAVVILLYAMLKLRRANNIAKIAHDFNNQLTEAGFANILFCKASEKILFAQGLGNIQGLGNTHGLNKASSSVAKAGEPNKIGVQVKTQKSDNIADDANIQFSNIEELLQLLRAEDALKLRDALNNPETEHNQSLLRFKNGQVVKYLVHHNIWQKKPAYALMLRNVHKEYQKMLSAVAENEALKHERKQHNLLLNNIPIPMWVRDAKMDIIYCNLAYMQLVDENDATIKDGAMPSLFKGARRIANHAMESKALSSSRHRLVVEGERILWNINELYVSELGGTIGFAHDISALEKVETEVTHNLSTLEDLLDSSSSAMIIYGANMRLKFYNQAYVRIWGVDETWLDSEPTFAEMIEHLRELRRLPEQINFAAFKQQRLRMFSEITEPQEELFYLPDGRTLRNVAIPNSAGGMLFIYEDVTDKLALERSYNTLIAVQSETLDNLHEGVVVFGEDGRLKLKNPTFLSLWDLEEKNLKSGIHISQLLDKTRHLYLTSNWELFKEELINIAQDRKRHLLRFERTDGAVIDCSIVPLPDGGVLITYIDNTASTLVERSLRERNEALEAGDKLKTEFLANMSYELRSPLTSISGFAEMLRQDYFGELSVKQREYVEGIYNSSQHLMHLINDILDLSSIEAGYMTLNITEFNVYKLLNTMTNLLSERLKEFELIAHIECAADIGAMHADETRIRQILFHLLSNAVKYSVDGAGSITLGAKKTNSEIVMWVQDNGVGISETEQKEVFDKFYRGSSGVRKAGTGLGLSMVKNFVELHGGYVEMHSELNKGTMVTCYLPIKSSDTSLDNKSLDKNNQNDISDKTPRDPSDETLALETLALTQQTITIH